MILEGRRHNDQPVFLDRRHSTFVDRCKKHDKGVSVLIRTSNKSSCELQDIIEEGHALFACCSPGKNGGD